MKRKILLSLPALFLILSLITSMIAFNYSKEVEASYLYSNAISKEPVFTGDYYTIFGNVPENSKTLSINYETEGYIITITNDSGDVLQSVSLNVEEDGVINNDVVEDFYGVNTIGDNPDYAMTLNLNNEKSYRFIVDIVENNIDQDEIDIGFFNLDNNLTALQDVFEVISVITFILGMFGILVVIKSLVTKK